MVHLQLMNYDTQKGCPQPAHFEHRLNVALLRSGALVSRRRQGNHYCFLFPKNAVCNEYSIATRHGSLFWPKRKGESRSYRLDHFSTAQDAFIGSDHPDRSLCVLHIHFDECILRSCAPLSFSFLSKICQRIIATPLNLTVENVRRP
jgi:hypothetical protein